MNILTHSTNEDCPLVQEGKWKRCLGHEIRNEPHQNDANFMAGVEVGVRCSEKGMNLQAALAFGRETLRLFPYRAKEVSK